MFQSSSVFLNEKFAPHFKTLNKDEQSDIESNRKVLKNQRESFAQELVANLKKIDTNVHELKKAISLDIKNVGLHYFKDVMKAITDCLDTNDNILNFKHKELLEQEKLFSAELTQYDQAVLGVHMANIEWTKRLFPYKPLDTHHINLPESISKFDEFLLKSGGHSGRWKPEDHQLFLQLKSKDSLEQVVEILHHKLPDISTEQVIEHNAWHKNYTRLLQDKKLAVETWKSSKKSGRSQSMGNIQEISRVETPCSNPSTGRKITRRSVEEMKKQIAEWKLAKSARLQEEHDNKKQQEKRKLAIERERQEIKMIEKQRATEYLSCKLETQLHQKQLMESKRAEEKKNRARKANIMIQLFRKQDEARLQGKVDRKKQLAQSRLETQRRLSRVKSEVRNIGRDPQRVMKPTAVWQNRMTGEETERCESTRDVTFITQVPRLKVPDWRQDVKFQDQIVL